MFLMNSDATRLFNLDTAKDISAKSDPFNTGMEKLVISYSDKISEDLTEYINDYEAERLLGLISYAIVRGDKVCYMENL